MKSCMCGNYIIGTASVSWNLLRGNFVTSLFLKPPSGHKSMCININRNDCKRIFICRVYDSLDIVANSAVERDLVPENRSYKAVVVRFALVGEMNPTYGEQSTKQEAKS